MSGTTRGLNRRDPVSGAGARLDRGLWTGQRMTTNCHIDNLLTTSPAATAFLSGEARRLHNPGVPGPPPELMMLFGETVALYLRLSAGASAMHGHGHLSGPRRTVLMAIADPGEHTVARLARARAQSRQRLQPLINGLAQERLIEFRPNPMHKRSPLVALTAKGQREVLRIRQIEGAVLGKLPLPVGPRQLADAALVLRGVREVLEQNMPPRKPRLRSKRRRHR
jgi:DNA-binding MarR family transcriptional regulator